MPATSAEGDASTRRLGRRHFLIGAGAAAGTTALSTGVALPAEAASSSHKYAAKPVPRPIPGGLESGTPIGFVHLFLPGPEGGTTPVLGLVSDGPNAEPSTITDFKGSVAFAVLAGEAKASDGNTYPCELDIRAMEGDYIAEDGTAQHAAFAFI